MKYKIIGLIACACALTVSLFAIPIERQDERRVHQHLEASEKAACTDHGDEVFCTHLPLVQIDTDRVEIPGKAIFNRDGMRIGYTTAADGADEITASITITDNGDRNNHVGDAPALESFIRIHVRGNSSRAFDKCNYSVRLMTRDGENNPQSVMGMDAHHEWVLHGPFLDKTLMRNYMWYNIAGEIMDYAPNVRFCELMLNGEYQGVYVMTESITAGKNGARLDLSVNKKDNTFSGYLLRLDRGSKSPLKNIETFSEYTRRTPLKLNIVYPGNGNLSEALRTSIAQDFSDFEKALYSYDFDDSEYGYAKRIDVDSFVDYFLINEFTCNYDAGSLSTYIYKGIDGRFRMCVWDFNSACDAYQESPMPTDGFSLHNRLWYFMLFKDEDFVERVLARYDRLRKTVLSEEYLDSYIDGVVDYLGDAIERNYEKWGYTFGAEYDLLQPADRNPRSYTEAIDDMKQFLHRRGAWLDENIHVLRQYAVESKIKKFNANAN